MVYWTSKDDVQVVCGCFEGTLEEFEERVREVHSGKHLNDYLKEIEKMKYLINS
jgi:hypothetical protein